MSLKRMVRCYRSKDNPRLIMRVILEVQVLDKILVVEDGGMRALKITMILGRKKDAENLI